MRRSICFVRRYVLSLHSPLPRPHTNTQHPACHIYTATTPDISNLLNKSPRTSCAFDPLPRSLLKDVSDTLVSFLTRLVYSSIASIVVPRCLNHTTIFPVLKKQIAIINISTVSANFTYRLLCLRYISRFD